MKKFWNNIKTFFGNLKKLYRLSQVLYFEGNTILLNSHFEACGEVRAGEGMKMYMACERGWGKGCPVEKDSPKKEDKLLDKKGE